MFDWLSTVFGPPRVGDFFSSKSGVTSSTSSTLAMLSSFCHILERKTSNLTEGTDDLLVLSVEEVPPLGKWGFGVCETACLAIALLAPSAAAM